mmetsp:Transcript_39980/g.125110  ORF Transcript_39980/g.125110 Transcript_39980/m.125110 type:complete len:203 (+) Transcript_39980:3382-3990(+)
MRREVLAESLQRITLHPRIEGLKECAPRPLVLLRRGGLREQCLSTTVGCCERHRAVVDGLLLPCLRGLRRLQQLCCLSLPHNFRSHFPPAPALHPWQRGGGDALPCAVTAALLEHCLRSFYHHVRLQGALQREGSGGLAYRGFQSRPHALRPALRGVHARIPCHDARCARGCHRFLQGDGGGLSVINFCIIVRQRCKRPFHL